MWGRGDLNPHAFRHMILNLVVFAPQPKVTNRPLLKYQLRKHQPGQLWPAEFFPPNTMARVYNIPAGGNDETYPLVAPLTFHISNARVSPTLSEYLREVMP